MESIQARKDMDQIPTKPKARVVKAKIKVVAPTSKVKRGKKAVRVKKSTHVNGNKKHPQRSGKNKNTQSVGKKASLAKKTAAKKDHQKQKVEKKHKARACYRCKSTSHLMADCSFQTRGGKSKKKQKKKKDNTLIVSKPKYKKAEKAFKKSLEKFKKCLQAYANRYQYKNYVQHDELKQNFRQDSKVENDIETSFMHLQEDDSDELNDWDNAGWSLIDNNFEHSHSHW